MHVVIEFVGDDRFSHLVNTDLLPVDLKNEIEAGVLKNRFLELSGNDYFTPLQAGAVFGTEQFPVSIEGMLTVYVE